MRGKAINQRGNDRKRVYRKFHDAGVPSVLGGRFLGCGASGLLVKGPEACWSEANGVFFEAKRRIFGG